MKTTGTKQLATTWLVALLAPAAASAQLLLPNGRFDHDIAGWVDPGHPDTEVAWDPFGNPGGSLRVTSTGSDPVTKVIRSQCISGPEGYYTFEADTYRPAPPPGGAYVNCLAQIRQWENPDCTGAFATQAIDGPNPAGAWLHRAGDALLEDDTGGFQVRSIAVVLLAYRGDPTGEATCHIDNVVLRGPSPTLEIPTASATGLALLAVLVGLAGAFHLRHRGGAPPFRT